jgi:hypothetical protein
MIASGRRVGLFLLWALLVLVIVLPGAASAQREAGTGSEERPTFQPRVTDEATVVPGRIIVKYEEDASSAEQAAVLREEGLK